MGFVRRHYWDEHWANSSGLESALPSKKSVWIQALLEVLGDDVKRLDRSLADIERFQMSVVPVLLKKYLHQNARILGLQPRPQIQRSHWTA